MSQQKCYIEKLILKSRKAIRESSQHINNYTHLEHSEQIKALID